MPLQATSGAASYDAFGGGVAAVPNYIEDVFSTYLYTGNGSTQTITNGIDLSTKGGLVWLKSRSLGGEFHRLFDTSRGVNNLLASNATFAQQTGPSTLTAFNTTGFNLGSDPDGYGTNTSAATYVSWTFRKQPKFFDVVTWTGDGTANRAIPHNLGSQPGFITCKKTSGADAWQTAHRGNGTTGIYGFVLNDSAQGYSWSDYNTYITSTVFYPDQLAGFMNTNGQTYVAYLFAHDAGGFGLTGTDNVISCGSWTGTGSNLAVNLGYEPQWLMFKRTDDVGDWIIVDNMRGFTTTGADAYLKPNTSGAETSVTGAPAVNATGFSWTTGAGANFIYIAIRRGPMKVPTSGTSVFAPVAYTGNGTGQSITTGITGDLTYIKYRTDGGAGNFFFDRLRNPKAYLDSSSTVAEVTGTQHITAFNQLGFSVGNNGNVNDSGGTFISQTFKRAPSFFDEVCYTGTGSARTVTHNLGVVPEMMIVKERSGTGDWWVYNKSLGSGSPQTKALYLSFTDAESTVGVWNNTAPTSSVFSVSSSSAANGSGLTYVAYLFATCAGVSKVFSFTGNGTTQTINCGFTGGARFVLLKASSATGGWYVYDTARGMTVLTDPYLQLNSTAAETATLGSVTTVTTGFAVNEAITTGVNTNGVTYIGLAIA